MGAVTLRCDDHGGSRLKAEYSYPCRLQHLEPFDVTLTHGGWLLSARKRRRCGESLSRLKRGMQDECPLVGEAWYALSVLHHEDACRKACTSGRGHRPANRLEDKEQELPTIAARMVEVSRKS